MDGLQVFFLLLHYSASTLFPFSCFTGLKKKTKPDILHIPCKNLNYRGICDKCNSHHSPKAPPNPRPCPVNHADCSFPWKESQTQMSPGAKVGNERSLDIDDRLVLDWGNLENEPCLLRIPQWPIKHIYRLDTVHWPPLSRCALLLMYYF